MPSNTPLAATFSVEGTALTASEKELFTSANPFGFILFARNMEDTDQLKKLNDDLRDCVGWHCPILTDEEGGRVQRMKPPHWPDYPAMKTLSDDPEALSEVIVGIAKDLTEVGIDVNCAPVLDVLYPETHNALGDRAFSDDPETVIKCGTAVCETLLEYGITPVMKHMPGLGQANVDSHHELPRVSASKEELQKDFSTFKAMTSAPFSNQIWGMVAHVIYEAFDADQPSTTSQTIINLIREEIGFDGLLLSDDLDMDALGSIG
ncbi:MAG: glycoside hydrolase family 3 N-terminal domain-containing protein, partial [Pseudomonadota bacterium]